MLYIFSDSNERFFISNSIDAKRLPLKNLSTHNQSNNDITYIDISTLSETERKKYLKQVKKRCRYGCCGVIDPHQTIEDPASLFFTGIDDYISGKLAKKPITQKRLNTIRVFTESRSDTNENTVSPKKEPQSYRTFSGWDTIIPGQTYRFCFLFVGIQAAAEMKSRLGDSGYQDCLARFNYALQQYCSEAAPHLWIETDGGILYLLPPFSTHIEAGLEGTLRMLLSAPLITYERLGLPFLTDFIFAFHIGNTEYAQKGNTGEIVSEAINFIYHLGHRKSDAGRITVSEDIYTMIENEKLKRFFIPHGTFESHKLFHSKRFSFGKKRKK